MYETHKFMKLSTAEVGFFIQQVGLTAVSFGVSTADATAIGTLLGTVFGMRCSNALDHPFGLNSTVNGAQSICIGSDCAFATGASLNATCYAAATKSGAVGQFSFSWAATALAIALVL